MHLGDAVSIRMRRERKARTRHFYSAITSAEARSLVGDRAFSLWVPGFCWEFHAGGRPASVEWRCLMRPYLRGLLERQPRSNDICIVQASVEELLNGRVERHRDVQVRVHVGERLEDEPPVGESGMRQGEI